MMNASFSRPKWPPIMLRSHHKCARRKGHSIWLWRAVDQDGYVLDEIVQVGRDTKAAQRLLIRLLKKQGLTPKQIITALIWSGQAGCDAFRRTSIA
jgi:transposase-like protein